MLAGQQKGYVGSLLGNCKNEHLRNNENRALQLLERCVYPVLAFRVGRWPPQKVVAQELNSTQAVMIASIRRTPPLPNEEPASFCRRRLKIAHSIAKGTGTWSGKWFDRFGKWNDHLSRHPSHPTSRLIRTRDSIWLQTRRSTFASQNAVRWNSWTMIAGRTDTRICRGNIAQRWENGLELARERV